MFWLHDEVLFVCNHGNEPQQGGQISYEHFSFQHIVISLNARALSLLSHQNKENKNSCSKPVNNWNTVKSTMFKRGIKLYISK